MGQKLGALFLEVAVSTTEGLRTPFPNLGECHVQQVILESNTINQFSKIRLNTCLNGRNDAVIQI
jgi:hypothetical protein